MSGSPWEPRPPPEPPPPPPPDRGRLWLWLALMAALAVLVFALSRAFPWAVRTGESRADLAYNLGFLALVAASLFLGGRAGLVRQHLRHAAIWAAIFAVAILAAAYREELTGLPKRLSLAFGSHEPVVTAERELVIPQADNGAFMVIATVNGRRIRFLVDTGASDTVLSPADARSLGVDPAGLDYRYEAETANGVGRSALFVADRLEVGPIRLDGFPMAVNQAPLTHSLLGMSFLRRLDSFEVRDERLILRWHDE